MDVRTSWQLRRKFQPVSPLMRLTSRYAVPAAAEHSTLGVGIVVVARQGGYVLRHCRSCPTLLERTCYDNLLTQLANVLPSVVLDRTDAIPCNNLLLDRPVQFYLDQAMSS